MKVFKVYVIGVFGLVPEAAWRRPGYHRLCRECGMDCLSVVSNFRYIWVGQQLLQSPGVFDVSLQEPVEMHLSEWQICECSNMICGTIHFDFRCR